MRIWGYAAGAAVLVLGGCSGTGATPADRAAQPPTTNVASSSPSSSSQPGATGDGCVEVSKAALKAVDRLVRAKGEGNSLPRAGSLRDADSGMWLIVGAFGGAAGQGEGALGIWATEQDPRAKDFDSPVLAVDDAASAWSTAEPAHDVAYDPANAPVTGCIDGAS